MKRFLATCISCDSVISPYVSYCESCYHDAKSGYSDEPIPSRGRKVLARVDSDSTGLFEDDWEGSHFNRNG